MKFSRNQLLLILLILVSGYGYIAGCTHDDALLPAPASTGPVITRGNHVHLPGTLTAGNPNEWKFDKAHSSVLWTTAYVGAAGLLTGRFNQFGIHDITDAKMINYTATGQPLPDTSWAFYENDPSKIRINGYVQINTSNTGEPGRDNGCNITTLGTTAIVTGTQNLTVTNLAKIQSTKVAYDELSNDYIVTLTLTWKGTLANPISKSIVGRLKYIPRKTVQFGTAAAYDVFGLQLSFQFNCRDFGIASTSIADNVGIEINANFNNK